MSREEKSGITFVGEQVIIKDNGHIYSRWRELVLLHGIQNWAYGYAPRNGAKGVVLKVIFIKLHRVFCILAVRVGKRVILIDRRGVKFGRSHQPLQTEFCRILFMCRR